MNPEIVDIGTRDFTVWDDCFSIPDLIVRVLRAYRVKVTYSDLSGRKHTVDAEGELAELLQHEIDHLDGKLFIDYLKPLKRQMITRKMQKLKREMARA